MIKYRYVTKDWNRKVFYTGTITGALLYSFCFYYIKMVQPNDLLEGLSYVGAILLGSTIAFIGGQLFKVKEVK
jgi:hypothetical protein